MNKNKKGLHDRILQEVKDRNYANLPFPISRTQFEDAANAFLQFLTLPQDIKNQLHGKAHPDDRGSHVGYVRKQEEDGKYDNKEYFHYNDFFADAFHHSFPQITELQRFLPHAQRIYSAAANTLSNILEAISLDFPDIHEKFFTQGKFSRFYLRFLKYDVKPQDGTMIAKGHYDRGAITLALAESAPGLRIGKQENPIEIVHQEHQAIFMPSLAIEDVTAKGYMPPAWHDVIQKGIFSNEIARWAIVFFADPIDQRHIEWEETHTR